MVAAKPLPPRERSRFLAELAYALGGTTPGDGELYRITRKLLLRHFDPPLGAA
jgi:hypothetical protein